ncbi:hypothetical protein [Algisphaera agarilytica]|uniref:Uncharacterized protein n=1 Tax=Algisphaera agarilytica TaxID=1385975 RepID=A0A7X0LK48_9BACT|nr:hypothetical protein [Algisphaera agarilytica]MBB6428583.1 hypothetical protein [Algisphaera agarilytica]
MNSITASMTKGLWCTLAAGLLLVGCATEPEMPEGTIRPLDPGTAEADSDIVLPGNKPVRWVSRRVSLPLGTSTEDAWLLANEGVLDDLARAVWNANGLRVGVLPAPRGPEFAKTLADTIDQRDTQILSYSFLEDVRESPPLRAEFFADLTVPPRPVTLEYFTKGRLRMLMSSQPLGNGSTRVTLTPQHYLRKTTLLPQTPQERELDGRVFDELSVEIDVASNQILLLGFYQPPPPVVEGEGESEPSDDAPEPTGESNEPTATPESLPRPADDLGESTISIDQPEAQPPVEAETQTETTEEEVDEIPPLNLGRGLFTTGIKDDDLQMLFLFRPLR